MIRYGPLPFLVISQEPENDTIPKAQEAIQGIITGRKIELTLIQEVVERKEEEKKAHSRWPLRNFPTKKEKTSRRSPNDKMFLFLSLFLFLSPLRNIYGEREKVCKDTMCRLIWMGMGRYRGRGYITRMEIVPLS